MNARGVEGWEERLIGAAPDGRQTGFDTEITEVAAEVIENGLGDLPSLGDLCYENWGMNHRPRCWKDVDCRAKPSHDAVGGYFHPTVVRACALADCVQFFSTVGSPG